MIMMMMMMIMIMIMILMIIFGNSKIIMKIKVQQW